MSTPPLPLDAAKQAHVDAVTAAAGGSHSDSAAALAHLKVVSSSALTFDVDADSEREDQRVLLGLGTYAEVFAGRVQLEEEGEPRRCAIKRLSVFKGLRPERLLQEALTMIKCQVEEQPLLLAMALGDGHYYLVLDRMDLTLAEHLKDHGPSPAARTRLLLRCADLLLQVHDEDVCHNDIKAANFLMSEDGNRMELCDFGFAVHRELQYLPDKVRGMPKFYAPELRKAAQKAGSRSAALRLSARGTEPPAKRPPADSFSFGALIQEAVFGEPYPRLDREQWLGMAASEPQRLATIIPTWPKGFHSALRELMTSCCSLQPTERPSTMTICEKLRFIVGRAEITEANQAEAAKPNKSAAPRSHNRAVVMEVTPTSDEFDSSSCVTALCSMADGLSEPDPVEGDHMEDDDEEQKEDFGSGSLHSPTTAGAASSGGADHAGEAKANVTACTLESARERADVHSTQ